MKVSARRLYVGNEDAVYRTMELTNGQGVDVAIRLI